MERNKKVRQKLLEDFTLEKLTDVPSLYVIINEVNNKIYLGKAKNCKSRIKDHFSELSKNGKYYNPHFQNSFNKYGLKSFKGYVIKEFKNLDEDKLYEIENELIKQYNLRNSKIGYNIAEGGRGGDTFAGMDEQRKQKRRLKISNSIKGELNGMYGKGYLISGENNPMKKEENRLKLVGKNNPMYGKPSPNRKSIKLINNKTNEEFIFKSCKDASNFLNFKSSGCVTDMLKNNKVKKGFRAQYI